MATHIPDDVEIHFSDQGAGRAFAAGIDLQELVDALRRPHFSQGSDEEPNGRTHFLKLNGIPAKIVTATKEGTAERIVIVAVASLEVAPLNASGRAEEPPEGERLDAGLRVAG